MPHNARDSLIQFLHNHARNHYRNRYVLPLYVIRELLENLEMPKEDVCIYDKAEPRDEPGATAWAGIPGRCLLTIATLVWWFVKCMILERREDKPT